jgi:hypothetical protein
VRKIVIFAGLMLASLGAWAEQSGLLVYQVREAGIDPYISRIIVTDDYVRLDEGDGRDGFTLFDRNQEIVYNVVPGEDVIFVMNPSAPPAEENPALILAEKVEVDPDAPTVAGKRPRNVTLLANGEVCSELVVIDGVMQDALDGLSELKQTLARIQADTVAAMPLDARTPCDLADSVHAADRSLRFGLPLEERNGGRQQSLVDFVPDYEVDAMLFELPAGFARRPLFSPAAI